MKHTPNYDFKPIFLDFETNKSGQFYLVGVKSGDVFQQWVLTQDLIGLAKAKHLEVQKAEDFALNILERMCEDNGVLVAYSSAELSIFNNLFDKNPLKKKFLESRYLNLLSAAKRWIRKHRKKDFEALPPFRLEADSYTQRRQKYSLASVMRLTSFQAEKDYAPGKTTSRFNSVMSALRLREQNFNNLTAVQKAKATKALKHNEFDVKAMSVLFDLISKEDASCFRKSIVKLFDDRGSTK